MRGAYFLEKNRQFDELKWKKSVVIGVFNSHNLKIKSSIIYPICYIWFQ
jgi:hypothetical protein